MCRRKEIRGTSANCGDLGLIREGTRCDPSSLRTAVRACAGATAPSPAQLRPAPEPAVAGSCQAFSDARWRAADLAAACHLAASWVRTLTVAGSGPSGGRLQTRPAACHLAADTHSRPHLVAGLAASGLLRDGLRVPSHRLQKQRHHGGGGASVAARSAPSHLAIAWNVT